jgi:hypothetical protein
MSCTVVGVQNMLVVQKGSSIFVSIRGLVGILEVSTTGSPKEFIQRICISYPGGIQKASRESETI